MTGERFDSFAKTLGQSNSRRGFVRAIGVGLASLLVGGFGTERALADTGVPGMGGNSACDTFCDATFVGQAQGSCTSQAAHGTGPCYTCGPAAPAGAPQACNVGTSAAACCPAATPTCCGNTTCVNLQSNGNCGACGHVCPGPTSGSGTPTCTGGVCGITCSTGQTLCGTACVNEQTDVNNCGACAHACAAGSGCCNGTCTPLNTTTNCGACGNVCTTSYRFSSPTCSGGTCGFVCDPGYFYSSFLDACIEII
jgi:hypothetical protein